MNDDYVELNEALFTLGEDRAELLSVTDENGNHGFYYSYKWMRELVEDELQIFTEWLVEKGYMTKSQAEEGLAEYEKGEEENDE